MRRILIAEDDGALAKFVSQGLEAEHYSVDVFPDGEQARTAADEAEYDVVILDLNLPKLDGVNVLRYLRLKQPSLPVLVLTQRTRVEDRVQCLDTGADDYIPKRMSSTSLDIVHIQADLIAKIKAAAYSHRAQSTARKLPQAAAVRPRETSPTTPAIVAIGTSTGGPKALQEILPLLTRDLAVPILIVQHMPMGFTTPFALRLSALCQVPIREAAHHDIIQAGTVYIAPSGLHMTVERHPDSRSTICLSPHPEHHLHIPSVDILMQSIAATYRSLAMGVIMTGMGSDGALGMKAIYRQGGLTVGQDEASCTVYGMPRACADLGVLHRVVPLSLIPHQIMLATQSRKRA
jgi:two-component system chemotaxis response regulator CheB